MNSPNSYEAVMKELEEINDLLEADLELDEDESSDYHLFRFEYAHESLTERNSMYKRRYSHA